MQQVSAEGGLTNQLPFKSSMETSEVWELIHMKLANDELSCRCTTPTHPSKQTLATRSLRSGHYVFKSNNLQKHSIIWNITVYMNVCLLLSKLQWF
jgi:hypothetical protein